MSSSAIHSYTLAGWSRVPDPVTCEPGELVDDAIRRGGFIKETDLGDENAGIWCTLYVHQHDERFLASVNTPCRWFPILLPDLPSCLAFLRDVVPTLRAVQELEAECERQEELRDEWRAGR